MWEGVQTFVAAVAGASMGPTVFLCWASVVVSAAATALSSATSLVAIVAAVGVVSLRLVEGRALLWVECRGLELICGLWGRLVGDGGSNWLVGCGGLHGGRGLWMLLLEL